MKRFYPPFLISTAMFTTGYAYALLRSLDQTMFQPFFPGKYFHAV
ncbi:hypothetical protein [Nostoc sp.]